MRTHLDLMTDTTAEMSLRNNIMKHTKLIAPLQNEMAIRTCKYAKERCVCFTPT